MTSYYTSTFARFTRSATSPSFAYVSNPAPDSSLCRAGAPRLLAAAPQLWVLLAACVRFSCCSPIASASAAACSLIASASAVAPQLRLLLVAWVRFSCCSPIASASTAAPGLRPLQLLLPDCIRFDCCFPTHAQCSRTFFTEFEVQ